MCKADLISMWAWLSLDGPSLQRLAEDNERWLEKYHFRCGEPVHCFDAFLGWVCSEHR